ncbi:MAG: histidine kinase [Mariprofundaceae bacterium]
MVFQVIKRVLLIMLPLAAFTMYSLDLLSSQEEEAYQKTLLVESKHHIHSQAKNIRAEILRSSNHLLLLSKQNEIADVLIHHQDAKDDLISELIDFAMEMKIYDQIRLLNKTGKETIRINYHDRITDIVETSKLQNKLKYPYFSKAIGLQRGQIYISPFDLNREYGKVERPFKPVIRFSTPIFDNTGTVQGVMVLNLLGNTLIQRYLDAIDVLGESMLLNSDGHIIYAEDKNARWGFVFPERHDQSLAIKDPVVWNNIIQQKSGQFITDHGIFTFDTIDVSGALAQVGAQMPHAWKVVSYVSKENIFIDSQKVTFDYMLISSSMLVIIMFVIWLWALSFERNIVAHKQLQDLSNENTRLLQHRRQLQEQERKKLAHALHDDMGQTLTAMKTNIVTVKKMAGPLLHPVAVASLQDLKTLVGQMHQSLREQLLQLRPISLDTFGLESALEQMISLWSQRTHIDYKLTCNLCDHTFDDELNITLYRVVQEALTNTAKHAHANHIQVKLDYDDHSLRLKIDDDGQGGDMLQKQGFGLLGMRERITAMNGVFMIESELGKGVLIEAEIPVRDRTTQ